MKMGIYWDLPQFQTTGRIGEHIDRLKHLNFSHVSTFLNNSELDGDYITWDWSPKRLAIWDQALCNAGITHGLCYWAWPRVGLMAQLEEQLRRYCDVVKPSEQEPDLEGNWKHRKLQGYPSLKEAGKELIRTIKGITPDVPMVVSTVPLHGELDPKRSAVAIHCEACSPQGYSLAKDDENYLPTGRYAPGKMQRLAYKRAVNLHQNRPPMRVIMALAAWRQRYKGKHRFWGMDTAYRACLDLGIEEIRYWSAKWLERNPLFLEWLQWLRINPIAP
jgi:hypothetical protein